MVCLHSNEIITIASQMFSLPLQLTFIANFLFNIECFKNFPPFSPIPFPTSGAQLKEAGC